MGSWPNFFVQNDAEDYRFRPFFCLNCRIPYILTQFSAHFTVADVVFLQCVTILPCCYSRLSLIIIKYIWIMRRPKTLLALLALVALMVSAAEQPTTYDAAPKAVKLVVKKQPRAKMLSRPETVSRIGLAMALDRFPMVSIPTPLVPVPTLSPLPPTCVMISWPVPWDATSSLV